MNPIRSVRPVALVPVLVLLAVMGCGTRESTATATTAPQPTAEPTLAPSEVPTSLPSATATITPVPTPVIPPWPTLQRGDWDRPEVFALQRLIRDMGIYLIADGKFGMQTRGAVEQAQAQLGLRVDGIAGASTWEALVRRAPVKEGDSGEAVRAAQHLLLKFGYAVAVNGEFDAEDAAALKEFEASVGLEPDGILDPQTWRALAAMTP